MTTTVTTKTVQGTGVHWFWWLFWLVMCWPVLIIVALVHAQKENEKVVIEETTTETKTTE